MEQRHEQYDFSPGGRQKESGHFSTHDPVWILNTLGLQQGHLFLDLGCWPGEYSLAAADIVGPSGRVYALDIWRFMVELLESEARFRGLTNLQAMVVDITADLPLPDDAVDTCLVSTVVNLSKFERAIPGIAVEVRRVLKPGGRLAIIGNIKKDVFPATSTGLFPSADDLESQLAEIGFRKTGMVEFERTFLIHFEL
jgi:ubiquinone/menaquinone biosynthesis C-methylase UbiE